MVIERDACRLACGAYFKVVDGYMVGKQLSYHRHFGYQFANDEFGELSAFAECFIDKLAHGTRYVAKLRPDILEDIADREVAPRLERH